MPDTGRSGALDWKGHLLLLHSASERVSALVSWIRCGLDNNEKVIFTEPTRVCQICDHVSAGMEDGCFTVRLGVRH